MLKTYKNIPDGMFGGCFTLFVGEHKDLDKILKKAYNVELDSSGNSWGEFFTLQNKDKSIVNCIWLSEYKNDKFFNGVLIHELLHLTISELKRRGFSLNSGSEEAYTYFIESVFKQAYDILNKKRSIPKKRNKVKHKKK